MKILFLIFVSCFLSACVTAKYDSKVNNPALLSDVTFYVNHYYGKGKSRDNLSFYREIIYFDSQGGIIVLRPDTSNRFKKMSTGKWSIEKEGRESTTKVTKTENSLSMRVRVRVPSTSSYDPRFEEHLCLYIQYPICTEDNKNALSSSCFESRKNCYLEELAKPIGGYQGALFFSVNHAYEEDFGRKRRTNNYRKINTLDVFREEKGDTENLQNQWKETKTAIQENLKRIALEEKMEKEKQKNEEERKQAAIVAETLKRQKAMATKKEEQIKSNVVPESLGEQKSTVTKNNIVIPKGCKLAKAASTITKVLSASMGCMAGIANGQGCIKNSSDSVRLVGEERWVQGTKLICNPLNK